MDQARAEAIKGKVKGIAADLAPGSGFVPKYGGEALAPDPGDPKTFVAGVFAYKDHVSVEFSEGADFDDPNGHLEGGGKRRRHVKLRDVDGVAGKDVRQFLAQALA
ncbi:DUF1801 domain-containing protein [Hasllibacter sp. MH4015]|uniref:DUF1801 domain-containing protein n=1 Tax=Hasllibacter sp. MH4015 TaxID=2854029 RepID=UPI001CD5C611|nr:DUF1801 domain-containing protein [Hasllibacter sp. MH4015]